MSQRRIVNVACQRLYALMRSGCHGGRAICSCNPRKSMKCYKRPYYPGSNIKYASTATAAVTLRAATQMTKDQGPSINSGHLPSPSPEQQVAIDTLLKTKNNLIVDAMAGSGKTTTILHLAQAAPNTQFLVLVYNRRLMLETHARVEALGISNVTVLNYHTLGVRFYTQECATDQGLKRVVEDDMPVVDGESLPDFSVLIMDEQQDLTPIMKRFVDKIIRDKGWTTKDRQPVNPRDQLRVVCLGDRRQEIYSFNNADSRFLTMAGHSSIFGYINDNSWTEAKQTFSNRVTEPNAMFLNEQLTRIDKDKPMQAVRKLRVDGSSFPRPRYVIGTPVEAAAEEVKRLLYECKLERSDIIILTPSTRGKSSAKAVANLLALEDIPVHLADSDIRDIPPEILHKRILICTYHQAKGIERSASIVLGFDQSYHEFYDKRSEIPSLVSNPQYVACTRAVEHLVLIHDHKWAPLPFVTMEKLDKTCDVIVKQSMASSLKRRNAQVDHKPARYFIVSGLCRNLSESLITKCLQQLDIKQVVPPAYTSPAPKKLVKDRFDLFEGVAHITGTSVPAIFEWWQSEKLSILESVNPMQRFWKKKYFCNLPEEYQLKVQDIQERVTAGQNITVPEILYIASVHVAAINDDVTKLYGIPTEAYTWITNAYANETVFTLRGLPSPANITKAVKYEKYHHRYFRDIEAGGGRLIPAKVTGVTVAGATDIFRPHYPKGHVLWEIKHMDTLQPEHLIQVVLYLLLQYKPSLGYLVSARTGQTVLVSPKTPESLMEILQILVSAKSGGPQATLLNEYTDEEFLEEAQQDFGNLVSSCALPSWFTMRPQRSKFDRRSWPSKTLLSNDKPRPKN